MPQLQLNLFRFLAVLAIAVGATVMCRAQTSESTEMWLDEPASFAYSDITNPIFAVTGQLLWLNRTEADGDQTLVTGTTAIDTTTILRMDDLNLPTEAGFRGTVLLGPSTGRYFELTYAGIFDQDATVTIAPNAFLQTTQQFFGASSSLLADFQYTASYESDLHTIEINAWTDQEVWRLRPFVGARWIRQAEEFQVFETLTPGNGGRADFSNDLIGAQLGLATVLWQRTDWFHAQAIAKAGMYHNNMEMTSSWNTGGVAIATLDRTAAATSCSGEVNITAVWHLTPSMNFHVGYTGLWLTEVGLVGDQNDDFDILAGTGDLDLGSVSYQGGHLGVTLIR